MVEGLGSRCSLHPVTPRLQLRELCVSTPKLGDTKIFLLDSLQASQARRIPRFSLAASILKLNLSNLKVLWKLEEKSQGKVMAGFTMFIEVSSDAVKVKGPSALRRGSSMGRSPGQKSPRDRERSPRVRSQKARCSFPCPDSELPLCGTDGQMVRGTGGRRGQECSNRW